MTIVTDEMTAKGQAARVAARELARLSGDVKSLALRNLTEALDNAGDDIQSANERDIQAGRDAGLGDAMLDRLLLNQERLAGMASDVRSVAALPDPVGETFDMRTLPNGLQVGRRRVPLGVIAQSTRAAPM